MSRVPVYFSHSYRREDRDVNEFFWRAFYHAGFSFTVDPGSTALDTTTLELMMARSVGFVAVVTFRKEEARYQCSPFILYEYGLAVQVHQPRLVLRDKRVTPRHFEAPGTVGLEFDVFALERCTEDLRRELAYFHARTSGRMAGRRFRQGRVGMALASSTDRRLPGAQARRAIVESALDAAGDAAIDLTVAVDDPWQLAENADGCDYVIVDLNDDRASQIGDFLLGRGTPLLKYAHRGPDPIRPERLLGSAPLRRATSADELVTYWDSLEEFEAKVRQQISLATMDRTELMDPDDGHRYFRSLGRDTLPVFVSNASTVNDLAQELALALPLENIPFFHYRFKNQIGLGERWTHQLDRMVRASKVFLPLIDGSYWNRAYCRKEYETAARLAEAGLITMVPVLLDGHENGPEIPYQGLDLRDVPTAERVPLVVSRLDEVLAAGTGRRTTATTDDTGPIPAGQAVVDIAIITILEEEYEAVYGLLKRVRPVIGSPTLDNAHAWVVGHVDAPRSPTPYTVALAKSRPGTNNAVVATKNTLQAFSPRCVLVVGIAGGLHALQLADVVVADRIYAYEYGKIDGGFQPRADLDSPTDAALTSAASTLAARYPDWYRQLDLPAAVKHLSPRIVIGSVASGDKVVDDPADQFFASIMSHRPGVIAVEMEGAGAAAAIQDAREMQRAVSFGMIRGISDLPRPPESRSGPRSGVSEQTQMRETWKVAASATAAAVAIQLIRLSWPRPPRAGTPT
ncbi:MAG TPA: TIR domain-containing protein [Streptosporangiaceae bacterium]|nr:TIR domain-containing protein [Streptosporangiaceae bacterium]